ncbi:hypothetical protein GH714_014498 [Hevea brasiliensis]|uniref:TFIIS central domain-containing protein n=1 Tax=Hevea brasiliensis TaxID=3981 RepID=A0A6A6MZP8_HEVBR|nr:hypothetical protein GH714_014498 [Hevea brasiliensis]
MAGEATMFKFLKPRLRPQSTDIQAAAFWGVAASSTALYLIQVGKRLRPLTKHSRRNIQVLASDVFALWKKVVLEQTNGDNKNGKLKDKDSVKAKPANAEKAAIHQPHWHVFQNVMMPCETGFGNNFYEALCKVSSEAKKDSWDDVNACDPIQVAVSVESVLFKHWGRSNGSHKIKYRSLMFNIKDAKNPDFRRKVLLGQVKPEGIAHLSSEEMASDEMQQKNQHIKQKALL